MKKLILFIMTAVAFISLSACGSAAGTMNQDVSAPSASAEADVKGRWYVSEVLAPDGTPATAEEMTQMGAGYTLELLDGGVYFVYGADGGALGQGQYIVSSGKLTCTVGEMEIVFNSEQAGTLRSRAEDGSVTVMARSTEQDIEGPGNSDVIDEGSPEDVDAPDDADITDQDSPEDDADAPDDSGVVEDGEDSPEDAPSAG
jgi:hypothetical protein